MKNREIKFRIWDFEEKRFLEPEVHFSVIKIPEFQDANFNNCEWIPFLSFAILSPRFEVQQFTGLLDSQGKEIYEGDVVMDQDGYLMGVRWNSECAGFSPFIDPAYDTSNKFKIVGNIFENPELLNQ